MSRPESHIVYEFGDFRLDASRRLLFAKGAREPCAITPKTFETILYFIEHAGELLHKDRLIADLWPGVVVEENSLTQIIYVLRRILGEGRGENRYIATVPGRGYQFVADVTCVREVPDITPPIELPRDALSDDPLNPRHVALVRHQGHGLAPPIEGLPDESPGRHQPRWFLTIGTAISLAAAAAIVFWIVTAQIGAVRESTSIAVLPFADLSPAQDQQYLADGIAEEVLNLLSRVTTLRVIARTSSFSFRGKDADVARISEALGVTHILEGSVRRVDDRIRVTVRLVDASNGSRLWSESYDEPAKDILALETNVARSVASELRANLQNLADVPTKGVSAQAYDLYLRGQHELRMREFGAAARYLEQAIAIDSGFIPAYHSLGFAYREEITDVRVPMEENRAKLREMVDRGLRLAPDDPGLLAISAHVARYDGNNKVAEQRLATAQQKDPSNRIVQRQYASFKLDQGYPDAAIALTRRIREIDPTNANIYVGVWAAYMELGNAKEAIAAAERYREIVTPTVPTADGLIAIARWVLLGDLAGGIEHGRRLAAHTELSQGGTPPWLALLYYDIGALQSADSLMERGRWASRSEYEIVAVEAYRHLVLGDIAEARRKALATLVAPKKIWGGDPGDVILLRLAVDAMLESGEAQRAVEFLEKLAPEYARYKVTKDIDPKDFSPAPVPVKSAFSSYPALYFPDYVRALRAVGDEVGANQLLDHMEAILELRRRRGLFVEERHAAEALALGGRTDAALDALEKAERDRTIYYRWHLVLLHNEVFAGFRDHPRFTALVERIQRDLSRQRGQLESAKN